MNRVKIISVDYHSGFITVGKEDGGSVTLDASNCKVFDSGDNELPREKHMLIPTLKDGAYYDAMYAAPSPVVVGLPPQTQRVVEIHEVAPQLTVRVGAKLQYKDIEDHIRHCEVLAINYGKCWVYCEDGTDAIVNASELNPRKSPEEIEREALIEKANGLIDNGGDVERAVITLIDAGYRKVEPEDLAHLNWLHGRFTAVHSVGRNVDYLVTFRHIMKRLGLDIG